MSQNLMKTLELIPLEGPEEKRVINIEVAKLSQTLSEMIDSIHESDEQTSISLPFPVEIMDKIIEFLVYHFDDPIEDIDSYLDDNDIKEMSEWDRHLLEDLPIEKIFTAIAIGDYLQIKGLTAVCKKTIDNKITDLSIKELTRMALQSLSVFENCQK